MNKAGSGMPRPFSTIVGELHNQAKVRQAPAFHCSSLSSHCRGYGKVLRGPSCLGQQLHLLRHVGALSIRPSQCQASKCPSCLMHGLWEDADSEGKEESSLLLSLVRGIPPLDINLISKEVSSDSTDAMKRTISGMLGLLPSDQFNVTVETTHEPLAKLFVSSMMTGYTLRNAEYRLCLKRSLDVSGDDEGAVRQGTESVSSMGEQDDDGESYLEKINADRGGDTVNGMLLQSCTVELLPTIDAEYADSLGPIDDKVKDYIRSLEHKLASVAKELEKCKCINTSLHMQNIVGEEKNDLLDYLRSLEPDKVTELSQPASSEVEGVIRQVINDLLDSPLTKLQYKGALLRNGQSIATNTSVFCHKGMEDGAKKCSASSLQFKPTVVVSRDHLARLLFWCMLMGHHIRGLEYQLELNHALSLSGGLES